MVLSICGLLKVTHKKADHLSDHNSVYIGNLMMDNYVVWNYYSYDYDYSTSWWFSYMPLVDDK